MVDERVQRRIDRLLDQIDEAMDQRDWKLVRELAEDALALDPGNASAETFLAAADKRLARTGDPAQTAPPAATAGPLQTATPASEDHPSSFSDGRYRVNGQTIGKLDNAAAHFEDAIPFCRMAGYRPELVWSLCDYGDVLKERDADGDQEKAVGLLDESLAISRELGMRPLMERVLSRRGILEA